MRLPDFLVIGAMKAGTTSLCRDLAAQPDVFFPSVKEPHTLCLDDVLTPEGRRRYAALFEQAGAGQICGEGSTGYAKLPSHTGVAGRAHALLGGQLRLVYIVREPVSRCVSQHYHMYRGGDAPRDFFEAVRTIPSIIDTSRYAMQLEPWLAAFGQDQICVVRFEDYVMRRSEVVSSVLGFLGATALPGAVNESGVHNAGEEQLLPPPGIRDLVRKVTRSQWYKRVVHPRTPQWVRDRMKASLYRPAASRPGLPSVAAVDYIIECVRDDGRRLATLLGAPEPLWDLGAVRDGYLASSAFVVSTEQEAG